MSKRIISMLLAVAMLMTMFSAFSFSTTAAAGAIYVTPTGAGSKDGSNWDNAMEGDVKDGLNKAWEKVPAGGTLYIGSGNYVAKQTISITAENGGTADARKTIEGVPSESGLLPKFFGQYTVENQDKTKLFSIGKGASYVTFKNISTKQYMYPFYTTGASEGLIFESLDLYDMADGLYLVGGATDAEPEVCNKNFIINNCNFTNFHKSSVRFTKGNQDMLVSNCVADAGGQAYNAMIDSGKIFPLGFHAVGDKGPDRRITYVNCVSMNAWQEPDMVSNTYWNGDGYASEGASYDITYIRCRSYNNTDGGWDDKCKGVTYIDCISANNKKNVRSWKDPVMINGAVIEPRHPKPEAGGTQGWWTGRLSRAKAYNSTFYNCGISPQLGGGEAYNCIFYSNNGKSYGIAVSEKPTQTDEEAAIYYNTTRWDSKNQTGTEDPEFVMPNFEDPANIRWDGASDRLNSKKFGASRGYFYDEATYATKFPSTDTIVPGKIADVSSNYSWAQDSIDYMVSNDYLPPITEVAFAPYMSLTRVYFTAMLVRELSVAGDKSANFDDMVQYKNFWKDEMYAQFYDDIAIAKSAGITNGVEQANGSVWFCPGTPITRQEMMVLVSRTLKSLGKIPADYTADLGVLNSYSDAANVAEWAKQDVANVIQLGIIVGSDGMINPLGNATRAEGAVVGKRIADSYK